MAPHQLQTLALKMYQWQVSAPPHPIENDQTHHPSWMKVLRKTLLLPCEIRVKPPSQNYDLVYSHIMEILPAPKIEGSTMKPIIICLHISSTPERYFNLKKNDHPEVPVTFILTKFIHIWSYFDFSRTIQEKYHHRKTTAG